MSLEEMTSFLKELDDKGIYTHCSNEHCHQCKDREPLINDGLNANEIIGLFNTNASIEEIQRVVEFV